MRIELVGGPSDGEYMDVPDDRWEYLVAETIEIPFSEVLKSIAGGPVKCPIRKHLYLREGHGKTFLYDGVRL